MHLMNLGIGKLLLVIHKMKKENTFWFPYYRVNVIPFQNNLTSSHRIVSENKDYLSFVTNGEFYVRTFVYSPLQSAAAVVQLGRNQ